MTKSKVNSHTDTGLYIQSVVLFVAVKAPYENPSIFS